LEVLKTLQSATPCEASFQASREKKDVKDKKIREKLSDIEKIFKKKEARINGFADNAVKRIKKLNPNVDPSTVTLSDYMNDDAEEYYNFKQNYALKRLKDKKRKQKAKKAHFHSLMDDVIKSIPPTVKKIYKIGVVATDMIQKIADEFRDSKPNVDLDDILGTGYTLKDFIMIVLSLASIDWSNRRKILMGIVPVLDRIQPDLFSPEYKEVLFRMIENSGGKLKLFFQQFISFLSGGEHARMSFFQSDNGDTNSFDIDSGIEWKAFINSDIASYGFQFLTFLVSSKNLKPMDVTWSGIEFFAIKAQKGVVKATEVVDCIYKLFKSIALGFNRYLLTGNFMAMFSSESLEAKAGELLSYVNYAKNHILWEKKQMTIDQYVTQLQQVKNSLALRIKTEERMKVLYSNLYNRVAATIAEIGQNAIRQGAKLSTYGVLLKGPSSVGKSWISASLLDYTLRVNGFPAEPENKAVINSSLKHDDTITNATRGILFDDISVRKANNSAEKTDEERIMQMHNNVTYPANKAAVEEKASTMMNIVVDIGSTNSEYLNAIELMKCPEAVLRRWQLHVEQLPRPEFRKFGSRMLDREKVKAHFGKCQFPDAWEFRISECIGVEPTVKGGKTFKMRVIDPPGNKDYFDMTEFLTHLRDNSKIHFDAEKESLECRQNTVTFTEDKLPEGIVKFDPLKFLTPSQVPKTAGFQANDISIESVKESSEEEVSLLDNEDEDMDVDLSTVETLASSMSFLHGTRPFFDLTIIPPFIRDLWVWSRGDITVFFWVSAILAMLPPLFLSLLFGFPGTIAGIFLFWLEIRMLIDFSRFLIQEMLANSVSIHRMHNLFNRVSSKMTDISDAIETTKSYFSMAFLMYGTYKWLSAGDENSSKSEEKGKPAGDVIDEGESNADNTEGVVVEDEKSTDEDGKKASIFQSSAQMIEERTRPDPYAQNRRILPFNKTTSTIASEDFYAMIAKASVHIALHDEEGNISRCEGFFEKERILRVPRHVFETVNDVFTLDIFYNEFHKDTVIFDKRIVDGKQIWQHLGRENVLLHLTDVRSFGKKDLSKFYGKDKLVTPVSCASLITFDKEDWHKHRYNVYEIEDEQYFCILNDKDGKRKYTALVDGYTAKYEGIVPKKGLCGATIVSSTKPHYIIGTHNAADDEGNPMICPILESEVREAMDKLLENSFYSQIDTSNSYEFHSNNVKDPEIHERNACNKFSTHTAVEIFGDIGRSGNTKFSTVETPMMKEVLNFFGVDKNPYVVPPSKGETVDGIFRCPWVNLIEELNICECKIPQSYLERAYNASIKEIDTLLDEYLKDEEVLKRVLTIDEAVNGLPGVKAANGVKMSTSAGIKYGGKKGDHVINDDYPYVINDYVQKDVEDKIETYKKGETSDTVFKFCLKDEALKEKKAKEFRTRAFSALPMDSVISFNMYYTASCSFLYTNPFGVSSAISLDPAGFDQDRMHHHLIDGKDYLNENGIILDFKAFDKTLPQSLMRNQWRKHFHISRRMGFTDEEIRVMESIAEEQVAPVCALNGALVRLNFTHTSGNGATSAIGSAAGKDVVRAAMIAIGDDEGRDLTTDEIIEAWVSIHMGDDLDSVVHKKHKWFDFIKLKKKLEEWNITITMADKDSEPTHFQKRSEHDFLKRSEHFCPLRNCYVGRLEKSSLMKSLLYILPSKKEEKEMQLGQMFASVADEMSLYSRDEYEEFMNFARDMKGKYNLKMYNFDFSHEYQVLRFMYVQSRLHSEYHARDKPFLDDLLSKCCVPEHWKRFLKHEEFDERVVKECTFQSDNAPTYMWRSWKQRAIQRMTHVMREYEEIYRKCFIFYNFFFNIYGFVITDVIFQNPVARIWNWWHFVGCEQYTGRKSFFLRAYERNPANRTWIMMVYHLLRYAWFKLFRFVFGGLIDMGTHSFVGYIFPKPDFTNDSELIDVFDLVEEYFPWSNDEMFCFFRTRYKQRDVYPNYESIREDIRNLSLEFQEVAVQYEKASQSYNHEWMARIQHHGVRKVRRHILMIEQGTSSGLRTEDTPHSVGVQGNVLRGNVVDYHMRANSAAARRRRHTFLTASSKRGILITIFILFCWYISAGSAQYPGSNELSNPKRILELTENKQQQNIDFNITNTGFTNKAEIGSDPSMAAAKQPDLTLTDFPLRPVKIAELVWNGSLWNFDEINPWEELLSHPTVARKLANFKMMKAKLVLDFITNGSPYLSGRGLFYYNPLHTQDNFRPANVDDRLCRISQRPHIYIDPTNSSGGTLEVPFIWPKNAVNIPNKEWQQLGVLNFLSISDLRHSNGETPYVNVTVMAHLEGLELYQTTETTVAEFQSENKRVVSRAATAVGNIAGKLKNTPVIGPYARATEEVSRTVGDIAQVFGFSKPNVGPAITMVKTTKMGSLAPTNDFDTSAKLTLDCKNETTIDPAVVGVSSKSEMTIPEIVNHECLLTRFRWDINDDTDTELLRIPVTPYIRSTFPDDGKIDLPPCAYMSTFFQHWRGTMEYEIDIICSKFHRGKIAVRVEPHGTNGRNEYNVTQREIFDITETTQHGISVGWSSDRNYLKICGSDKTPFVPGESPDLNYHNGVLVISVANNLQRPSPTAETFVDVLVRVRANKDMQFNIPHSRTLDRIQMLEDTGLNVPTPVPPPSSNIYPHPGTPAKTNFEMGVYYYGWHVPNFNNNEGYVRKFLTDANGNPTPHLPLVIGRNPAGEEYDDRQRDVTRKQFDTMLKAGITFIVCSWWGNGSRTDIQFETAALPECGNTAHGHMRACIHYETATLKNIGNGYNWTTAVRDRVRSDMAKVKASYTTDQDRYLFRIDHNGVNTKPVIYLYLFRSMPDAFKRSICDEINDVFSNSAYPGTNYAGAFIVGDYIFGSAKTLPTDIQQKIGAITAYDVYGQTVGGTTTADINSIRTYHDRIDEYRTLAPEIETFPTISPSYNDRGVRLEADHIALDRALAGYDKGSLLKLHLENLIQRSGARAGNGNLTGMCVINSWNEWHEETTIEPCVGTANGVGPLNLTQGVEYEPYGTKYVNLIGDFMVNSYVAQSDNADLGEAQEEHNHDMTVDKEMLHKQKTYANDDLIYHGEKIASIGMMLSRFELSLKVNTSSTGVTRLHLPAVPYYEVDRENVDGATFYEVNMNRLAVLFLTRRGSTRWKALNDFHNTTPRIAAVKLEEMSKLELLTNQPSNDTLADGWSGMSAVTGVYDPVLEWEVPYYSNERFHVARSLDRSNEIGHSHVYDTSAVFRNYYLVAAGEDFTLSYFLGTPSIVIS